MLKRKIHGAALAMLLSAGSSGPVIAADGANPASGVAPGAMPAGAGYGSAPGTRLGPPGYGPGPAMGHGRGFGPPGSRFDMIGGLGLGPVGRLNLTDQQLSTLQSINDRLRKRHWEMMGEMMDVRVQLRDALSALKPDPEKVGAAYGEIGRIHQQMAKANVRAHNQVVDLLTEQQRAQLQEWHRRMGAGG